jgi:hypothetical protein
MKNLFLLTVILSLALMGCEKESVEPEIINNYDTIYVAQEPSEIGAVNYNFEFPYVFDTERGLIGVGNNQVKITDSTLRFTATSLNAETNTHVGGTGDFDSIRIDYVDFDNGIVIGTIFGSHNLAGELQVTNGTFKYEDGISFEVSLEATWGTMNLFLYN